MKKIPFTKMHGCGNDYIYVNTMLHDVPSPSEAAIAWSDRHKGIGSDGLVLIGRSGIPEADFSMRIFNADGSEAMMCGNASRCIGKYLYERGFLGKKVEDGRDAAGAESTTIRLLTRSGIKTLWLDVSEGIVERVTVDMLEPILEDQDQFLDSCGLDKGTFVSMGNPHYVIFTDDVDQVGETGRTLEHHPAFPQRCNIEFARVESDGTLRTRVWERGSGITQACGTGACATAVAAVLTGRASRQSQVAMDGGTLSIEWCEKDHISNGRRFQENHVYMTGPATFVYDGEIEPIIIS